MAAAMEPLPGNYAEQLSTLAKHGDGLLKRCYAMKEIFEDQSKAPSFVFEPALSKVILLLERRFPELPQTMTTTPGFDTLDTNAGQYVNELVDFYDTFDDCLIFKEAAYRLLTDIATASRLQYHVNRDETILYLELLLVYGKLHLLLPKLPGKLILMFYAKAFQIHNNTTEARFRRLAQYLQEYDEPLKVLNEEFDPIRGCLEETLADLAMPFFGLSTIDDLRQGGAFNINVSTLPLDFPTQAKEYYERPEVSSLNEWFLWGCLLCPELLSNATIVAALKVAMTHNYSISIFNDMRIPVHPEMENVYTVWKSRPNMPKNKKFITESASEAASSGLAFHASRRTFLRRELRQMLLLFADRPALFGPKIQMVWSALAYARDEIEWYVSHAGVPLPAKAKAPANFDDPDFVELIYYVERLHALILHHRDSIARYYVAYLSSTDTVKLAQAIATLLDSCPLEDELVVLLNCMLESIQAVTPENAADLLPAFRLNWLRLQCIFTSRMSPVQGPALTALANRANIIVAHSRNVDCLDDLIHRYVSLYKLWWHRDFLTDTFRTAIRESTASASYAFSILRVADMFVGNSDMFIPDARIRIGEAAKVFVTRLLNELCDHIATTAISIGDQFSTLLDQLDPLIAAEEIRLKRAAKGKNQKGAPQPMPRAGEESSVQSRDQVSELDTLQRNLAHTCAGLNAAEAFIVYDVEYAPREMLLVSLSRSLKGAIHNLVGKREVIVDKKETIQLISRPSFILAHLDCYMAALQSVEHHVDIDIARVLRRSLLSQATTATADAAEPNLVDVIAQWYAGFVTNEIKKGAVYSPIRATYVTTRPDPPYQADCYVEKHEIRALVQLLGPYGVRTLNKSLADRAAAHIATVGEILTANAEPVDELCKNFYKLDAAYKSLQAISRLDELLHITIAIGNILTLRRMITKELNNVVSGSVPYIYDCVKMAFDQYPENATANPALVPIDLFAADCGLDVGTADHVLRDSVRQALGGSSDEVWLTTPALFAAMFASQEWNLASYIPELEGHQNNAHTLGLAIYTVLSVVTLCASNSEAAVKAALGKFVEVASVVLLRLASEDGRHAPKELPAMFVVLDSFAQATPSIRADQMEKYFPYCLVRSSYRSIYRVHEESAAGAAGAPEQALED